MANSKKYYLRNKQILQNAIEQLNQTPIDYANPHTVKISEPERTSLQNRKLHAMFNDIAGQIDYNGRFLNPEHWKEILVSAFCVMKIKEKGEEPDIVIGIEGEFVFLRKSTARMAIRELGDLIEYIYAYAIERGVKFRELDPYGFPL